MELMAEETVAPRQGMAISLINQLQTLIGRFAGCVTLNKFLNLSGFHFSSLLKRDNSTYQQYRAFMQINCGLFVK